MKKKLSKPVFVHMACNAPPVCCETFGEYVCAMMYPEPTYVILQEATEELLTNLINSGKVIIYNVIRTVSGSYHYDDEGREYIEFPKPEKMRRLLQVTA